MPDRVAMREKDFGVWQEVTWADVLETVPTWRTRSWRSASSPVTGSRSTPRTAASGSTPTWRHRGPGVTVGLYPTNPAPEVGYLLADSGAKILVAEDQEQVDKALAVIDDLPDLEQHRLPGAARDPAPLRRPAPAGWDELLELGREHRRDHAGRSKRGWPPRPPDDLATLIYTSGTTGPPKGAMLTVANIEFGVRCSSTAVGSPRHRPPTGT